MTRQTAGIRIEDVHLSFGPTKVLEGIDMEIRPGEFFAFLGPSGSGKSTIARAVVAPYIAFVSGASTRSP